MFTSIVRNRMSFVLTSALLLACIVPAVAGGFGVQILLPDRQDPRMRGAFLVVRPGGCAGPGASVTATAEGIVDGQRKSVTVTLTLIPKASKAIFYDTYTLKRQWPTEGTWILVINAKAKSNWAPCHALIELEPNGAIRMVPRKDGGKGKEIAMQYVQGDLKDEVDTVLKTTAQRPTQHDGQTIASGVH